MPAPRFHAAGKTVRSTTPAKVTLRHLRSIGVESGQNILEIGTGSGYAAALLAAAVGPRGNVTTLDINSDLVARAKRLYATHSIPVSAVCADGMPGFTAHAPYDRIIVGATPPYIPAAWIQQLTPAGVLFTGARLSPLPGSYGSARITKGTAAAHGPDVCLYFEGSTPMVTEHEHPGVQQVLDSQHPGKILSSLAGSLPDAGRILSALCHSPFSEQQFTPLEAAFFHFKNWMLAERPPGLFVINHNTDNGIGVAATGDSAPADAAFVQASGELIAVAPDSPMRVDLRNLIDRWKRSGMPSTSDLLASLTPVPGDRYEVRLQPKASLATPR
ncbi:protein-L-isoaspartate O-methyltransferase [Streptomyces sp. NPDC056601]|uniref:protein-L-isoaspartate O-methyltransferase family protein n=1 Tax=Streptomyces sp. NPDC056601 TaxID=3345875 RepID=UPI0036D0D008